MNFRTEYKSKRDSSPIDVSETVVLLGSCFTTSIGERMRNCRWRAYPNPCGVLYNPMSIAWTVEVALSDNPREALAESVVERDGKWFSWLADSKINAGSPEKCVELLEEKFSGLRSELERCATVIITFGTSWIYEKADTEGYVVANCHKFPEKTFVRRRLSAGEITERWIETISSIRRKCGDKRFIFTVSPIRHLRDGFEGNSLSKATLLLACGEICGKETGITYFPSFEIVNDDLRDYRFYASDMLHPSETAVDYIWSKFRETFVSEEDNGILDKGEKVTKALSHRPIVSSCLLSETADAGAFSAEALDRLDSFLKRHPGMLGLE